MLVLEDNSSQTLFNALALQRQLWGQGAHVRLENKPKKLNLLLDSLAANGFGGFALVSASSTSLESLEVRAIGQSVE